MVSPVFFGWYPWLSLHSFIPSPLSLSLISHLAALDIKQNGLNGLILFPSLFPQLKLNNNKTEILFPFSSSLKHSTVSLPDLITLGSHNIPFSDSARNLGFILDSKLSMKKHVIKICQTAYFQLKCVSSVCRFLTEDATKTLVTSYILSQLDYCNCLLMGTPNSVIQPLQKIQNFAARLVLLAPCHHHSTPLLEKLHWLPISERIKYKVASSAISGSGPAYL